MGNGPAEYGNGGWVFGTIWREWTGLHTPSDNLTLMQVEVDNQALSLHPTLKISKSLLLRAILVVSTPDLDLRLWHVVLSEEEQRQDEAV